MDLTGDPRGLRQSSTAAPLGSPPSWYPIGRLPCRPGRVGPPPSRPIESPPPSAVFVSLHFSLHFSSQTESCSTSIPAWDIETTECLSSVASSLASMFAVFAEIREEKGRPIYGVREFCEDKGA